MFLTPVPVSWQKSNDLNARLAENSVSGVTPRGLGSSGSRETKGNSDLVIALADDRILSLQMS